MGLKGIDNCKENGWDRVEEQMIYRDKKEFAKAGRSKKIVYF